MKTITPEEVERRFRSEVCCGDADALRCTAITALAFAKRLAAELQAPPMGEEVKQAWNDVMGKSSEIENRAYRTTFGDDGCADHVMWHAFESAVRAYGAACARQAQPKLQSKIADMADELARLRLFFGRDVVESLADLEPGR